jgi:hypothetical protein
LIIAWIGATVSAEPAPKPAAVMPAARPRLSGNHFSALPTQDAAGADARDDHAEIGAVERRRLRVDRPADGAEDAADQHDEARAVFIDEPACMREKGAVHALARPLIGQKDV